jgi:hypothetical protein
MLVNYSYSQHKVGPFYFIKSNLIFIYGQIMYVFVFRYFYFYVNYFLLVFK